MVDVEEQIELAELLCLRTRLVECPGSFTSLAKLSTINVSELSSPLSKFESDSGIEDVESRVLSTVLWRSCPWRRRRRALGVGL
jgi:hypothetical protein